MNRPEFTREPEDWICHQIGEWYFEWRSKISSGDNRLGFAKEKLKERICGNVSRETSNCPPDNYNYTS